MEHSHHPGETDVFDVPSLDEIPCDEIIIRQGEGAPGRRRPAEHIVDFGGFQDVAPRSGDIHDHIAETDESDDPSEKSPEMLALQNAMQILKYQRTAMESRERLKRISFSIVLYAVHIVLDRVGKFEAAHQPVSDALGEEIQDELSRTDAFLLRSHLGNQLRRNGPLAR